jgi:hypothetical protein
MERLRHEGEGILLIFDNARDRPDRPSTTAKRAYSRAWKVDVRRVFFIIRGG